jgi:hypothetical protein
MALEITGTRPTRGIPSEKDGGFLKVLWDRVRQGGTASEIEEADFRQTVSDSSRSWHTAEEGIRGWGARRSLPLRDSEKQPRPRPGEWGKSTRPAFVRRTGAISRFHRSKTGVAS